MSADFTSVDTTAGFTIESSEPITSDERKVLTAKPIPPGAKPGKEAKAEKAEPEFETEAVDERGRTHDKAGKFKGKPGAEKEEAPEPKAKVETKQEEKAEEAPDETEEARAEKKVDAQSRIRDLAAQKNAAEARSAGLERQLREERAAREKPEPKVEPKTEATEEKADVRPNVKDYDDWGKYENDLDAWNERKAEAIAAKAIAKDRDERASAERQDRDFKQLEEAITAGDAAIKEAGGLAFLDKVAPTMGRVMPRFEAERLGLDIKPIHLLGDFVTRTGKRIAEVMQYIHESDPGIVDRFEDIGRLPASRQPLMVERELGMLYGALKALRKVKASVTTDAPEPGQAAFKRRAEPPPPSVVGSPHIAEPDLSNVEDFDLYMAKTGQKRRK